MIVHVSNNSQELKGVKTVASFDEALGILRKAGGEKKIVVHGGTYPACSIKLTKEDNGLTIEAAGGEKPVLSGAVTVSDWSCDEETGWFVADVPAVDGKQVDFRLLLKTDGTYLKKARYPLNGRLEHETVFTAGEWVGSHAGGWQRPLLDDELNHFTYKKEDISDDFDAESAEIQVYHSWNESYCKVSKHDRENCVFWLTPNCTYPPGSLYVSAYAVYNTKEGMAEDGRWYCNRGAGKIYYRPYPNENVESFACFVPVTTKIIEMEDGCENITIKGLSLTAATTPVVNEKYLHPCQRGGAGFGVMEQDGAIYGKELKNIEINDVDIYNTGGYGIMLRGESLHVRRCNIKKCGAGGIGISSENLLTPENRYEDWVSCVEDCRIENIALDYLGAVGIFSNSAMLRRNYIAETSYTSIIANGDYCVVENNICINPMLVLNDGACIYMHINKGCIVRGNMCLCEKAPDEISLMCWAIYLDSDTTDFEICNNVIKGFKRAMLDARMGDRNRWHHNYMEYSCDIPGHETMSVELPTDKRIDFHSNIMNSENIKIIYSRGFFDQSEDMNFNTAVCKNIVFEYRKNKNLPEEALPEFGGTNVKSEFVSSATKGADVK